MDWVDDATFVFAGDIERLMSHRTSAYDRKIILLDWWFYRTFNIHSTIDLSWADLIVCASSELIHHPFNKFDAHTKQALNNENCVYMYNGYLKDVNIPNHRVFNSQCVASMLVYGNTFENTHARYKDKLYDCLLGIQKPNRKFVFDQMRNSHLLENTLLSAYNPINTVGLGSWEEEYQSEDLAKYESVSFASLKHAKLTSSHSNSENIYYRNTSILVWTSFLVPWEIYRHTWYSIAAETTPENHDFVTEKTYKPIFAKRVFVSFASHGHLAHLHDLGYATFADIMDESYDEILAPELRWAAAWEQVEILAKQNPRMIYQKINDVLDHNHNHLVTSRRSMNLKIKEFIQSHIDKL